MVLKSSAARGRATVPPLASRGGHGIIAVYDWADLNGSEDRARLSLAPR